MSFDIKDIVKEARMSLIKTEPFYASILLRLKLVETKKVNTFAINSKELLYNPDFASSLKFSTTKVILMHEILHLVFKHHLRGSKIKNYNHHDYNVAADLALNCEIFDLDGFPEDALLPGRGDYIDYPFGKSAEYYYDLIQKKKEEEKENQSDESQEEETDKEDSSDDSGSSSSSNGDSSDDSNDDSSGSGSESSDEESSDDTEESSGTTNTFGEFEACEPDDLEEAEQEANSMVMQAIAAAQEAGDHVPSSIKEKINELTGKGEVNWKVLLRNYLSSQKKAGYNWLVPSRRVRSNFIMPTRQVKTPGDILFVMDTSCSMRQEDFDATLTEGQNALLSLDSYDLWQFDTEIRDERTITKNTNLEDIEMVGRGGTKFQCVADKLKTLRKKPKLMVVMTDLEFEWDWQQDNPGPKSFKEDLKGIDCIWLSTSNLKGEVGKTIHVK